MATENSDQMIFVPPATVSPADLRAAKHPVLKATAPAHPTRKPGRDRTNRNAMATARHDPTASIAGPICAPNRAASNAPNNLAEKASAGASPKLAHRRDHSPKVIVRTAKAQALRPREIPARKRNIAITIIPTASVVRTEGRALPSEDLSRAVKIADPASPNVAHNHGAETAPDLAHHGKDGSHGWTVASRAALPWAHGWTDSVIRGRPRSHPENIAGMPADQHRKTSGARASVPRRMDGVVNASTVSAAIRSLVASNSAPACVALIKAT